MDTVIRMILKNLKLPSGGSPLYMARVYQIQNASAQKPPNRVESRWGSTASAAGDGPSQPEPYTYRYGMLSLGFIAIAGAFIDLCVTRPRLTAQSPSSNKAGGA